MNEFENKDTGHPVGETPVTPFTGDAPGDTRWRVPDSLPVGTGPAPKQERPPVPPTPQPYAGSIPTYPQPPVYNPNPQAAPYANRTAPASPEAAPVYSTGVVPPAKNHTGFVIALIIAGFIVLSGMLVIFGLIPGLPNYRFAADPDTTDTLNNPGFAADGTPQPSQNTALPPNQSSVTMELESIPTSQNATGDGQLTLQEIYTKTIPSVASIICDSGSGTGVVLTKDGYVITNYHVIKGARNIQVLLSDGRKLTAKTIGRDEISDLAVLHISANDLTPATFANSDQVQVGDTVVAIGDPLGVEFRGTMTDGIISAINRDVVTDEGRTMTVIQTNAALNPGNSGGPLINAYGQVIGINTMKIGDTVSPAGVEGLGFAIPSTTVKTIVEQLMSIGHVTGRPYLGINTEEYGLVLSYLLPPGLYITHVVDGTDAAAKGITGGEVLLEFNGVPVTSNYELQNALEKCKPGETVTLVLYRQGSRVSVDVVLGEAQ